MSSHKFSVLQWVRVTKPMPYNGGLCVLHEGAEGMILQIWGDKYHVDIDGNIFELPEDVLELMLDQDIPDDGMPTNIRPQSILRSFFTVDEERLLLASLNLAKVVYSGGMKDCTTPEKKAEKELYEAKIRIIKSIMKKLL